jgi:pimeloyl-ACP methyl ester carboxylesterase
MTSVLKRQRGAAGTVETEQRQLEVDGSRLFYQEAGAGEAVVLLHGLSGSARWWQHNLAALTAQFRVLNVDLIGFGRSRGQRFVLRETARLLATLVDRLELAQAHLVGHSMGGYVAADVALHYPARVNRLVLVNAAAVPFHRTYVHDAWGLAQALRYVPFNFLPVLLSDALTSGPVTLVRALREIVAGDLSEDLGRITTPALVVWGEHDTVIPLAIGRRLHAALPNAQWAVIPGAGHNPMWDRPAAFNRVVVDFLTDGKLETTGAET